MCIFPRTNALLRGNRVLNKKFQKLVEALDPKLKLLMTTMPVSAATIPKDAPVQAVYLFSESGLDMYVGRTNTLRRRMWQHSSPSAAQNQASLAFRLAQQLTGITTEGGRAALSKHPMVEIEQAIVGLNWEIKQYRTPLGRRVGSAARPLPKRRASALCVCTRWLRVRGT